MSYTNFMLLRVGHRCPPAWLVNCLCDRGYLVKRPFETPCLVDCIRVPLGPPVLMNDFAGCLKDVLESTQLTPNRGEET